MASAPSTNQRRTVAADLVEASPSAVGQWVLASPFIAYLAWMWVDLFVHYSPIPARWLDMILGLLVYIFVVILPLGLLAHRLITSFPRLFQNAGWELRPAEPVSEEEQYIVRYVPRARERAATSWPRLWLRAAQGWVYLEISAILLGGLMLIPIFMSASEFGFGR